MDEMQFATPVLVDSPSSIAARADQDADGNLMVAHGIPASNIC